MKPHFLFLYALLLLPIYTPHVLAGEQLHIAVASNFKKAQKALTTLFETQYLLKNPHSKLKIINSSGSSGTLFAQIKNGAPYDVFLSADELRPDTLIELGLAKKSNRLTYAQGQIVLWQPTANKPFDITILSTYPKPYVLANPKLAPYGAASKALMEQSGLWKPRDSSRILAHNIATSFQYAASGSVTLAWVAYSQIKTWEQHSKVSENSYWLPPVNNYPEINQVAVQLKRQKNQNLASQYILFLAAPKAQSLIKSFGYLIPKSTTE